MKGSGENIDVMFKKFPHFELSKLQLHLTPRSEPGILHGTTSFYFYLFIIYYYYYYY